MLPGAPKTHAWWTLQPWNRLGGTSYPPHRGPVQRVQALTYFFERVQFSLSLRAHTPFVDGPNVIGPVIQWSGPATTVSCFRGNCNYVSVSTNYLIIQASVKRNYFTFKHVREIWEIFKKGQGKSGKSRKRRQGKSGGKSGWWVQLTKNCSFTF